MSDGERIGEVAHFFNRLCVAVVRVNQDVKVGDVVHFLGRSTDFHQVIASMQVDHEPVSEAGAGQEVAIKVERRVRGGDSVFRLTGQE
jgi:translation initiation factor IF-2